MVADNPVRAVHGGVVVSYQMAVNLLSIWGILVEIFNVFFGTSWRSFYSRGEAVSILEIRYNSDEHESILSVWDWHIMWLHTVIDDDFYGSFDEISYDIESVYSEFHFIKIHCLGKYSIPLGRFKDFFHIRENEGEIPITFYCDIYGDLLECDDLIFEEFHMWESYRIILRVAMYVYWSVFATAVAPTMTVARGHTRVVFVGEEATLHAATKWLSNLRTM